MFLYSLNEISRSQKPKIKGKTFENDIIQNPQIYKISHLLNNKKQVTKSSEHKQENLSLKLKSELFYKSSFKPKISEINKTINDPKNSFDLNNEKSLTIPNESSFRDEKLDHKIKKNILDFSKTSSGPKKSANNSKMTQKETYKNHQKIENILLFSDSFSKYHLNFDKDKKNPLLPSKITPNKIFLDSNKTNDNKNNGNYNDNFNKNHDIISKNNDNFTKTNDNFTKNNEYERKSQPVNPRNYPGLTSSINRIKNFVQPEVFTNYKPVIKDNAFEIKKAIDSLKKSSIDFQTKDKNMNKDQNINKDQNLNKKSEIFSKASSNSEKHKQNSIENSEVFKMKNLEYYLKNGIFQTLNMEKSESPYLFEMLEKIKFNYYVCDSIIEQKDEVKLFLTSNTHYKTSKRILLLCSCKKNI